MNEAKYSSSSTIKMKINSESLPNEELNDHCQSVALDYQNSF